MSTVGPASLADLALCEGRYRIVDLLDESDFAQTYVAETEEVGVDVTVRFATPTVASNEAFRTRFAKNVTPLQSTLATPFTRILEIGEHERTPFVVSEFVTGGTLDDRRLRDHAGNAAPLDPDQLTTWLVDVAGALDEIHAKGFVYRDLRPANVLFDIDGRARLAEFAIPYAVQRHEAEEGPNLTSDLMPVGAAESMAPEMILDGICDARSDQYALAILVYDCLCGRPPFHGSTRAVTLNAHTEEDPPRLSTFGLKVPRPVEMALGTALAKEPGDRFPTCGDFASTLIAAVNSGSIRATVPHSGDSIVAQAPADSAIARTKSVPEPESPTSNTSTRSDTWINDDRLDEDWPEDTVAAPERSADTASVAAGELSKSSLESPAIDEEAADSGSEPLDESPSKQPSGGGKPEDGGNPWWKRPFVVVSAIAIVPVVGVLAYFGYVLFLKPAEEIAPAITFNQKKPGTNPAGRNVGARAGSPGRNVPPSGGDVPDASSGDAAHSPAALGAWMRETKITVDVAAESPIEAFEQVLATREGTTLAIDVPALATLGVCGFRLEAKYEDAPLAEIVKEIGGRLPGLCVAVTGDRRGRLTTRDMADLAGWNTVGLIDAPMAKSLEEAAAEKIFVDVAGKKIETALNIVAAKAGIDVRIDEAAAEHLQDVLPADFYVPGTEARLAAAKLVEGRPVLLAYDPEFADVLRVTTVSAAESEGLRLLQPERAGLETRLGRQPVDVPAAALEKDEDVLEALFAALLEPAEATGVVEVERLQDEGLEQDVLARLRRVIDKSNSSSPSEGEGEESPRVDDPMRSVLGALHLLLERNPEVVVVLDGEKDQLVLTTAAAVVEDGREAFPVRDAVRQLVAQHRAESLEAQSNTIGQEFVIVDPGQYVRGAGPTDAAADDDERPRLEVWITRPLLMATREVTQLEFALLCERNPSEFCSTGAQSARVCGLDASRLPVENVTWFDAIDFCNRLSVREGLAPYYDLESPTYGDDGSIASATVDVRGGSGYRLPTEAEWEYVARAGQDTPWSFGEGHGAKRNSWFDENAGERPHVVATRQPNGFGLHNLHGNVREWVQDWYSPTSYPGTQTHDPTGKRFGTERVVRGGGFSTPLDGTRSSSRDGALPGDREGTIGFRVCRTLASPTPSAE